MIKAESFLSTFQFNYEYIDNIIDSILAYSPRPPCSKFNQKVVGIIFEEPSSRTRFSTESAVNRLGANAIVTLAKDQTSIAKGETYQDSAFIWSESCDLLCIRSINPEIPSIVSSNSSVPVINLGDGWNEHPTQALATLVHTYKIFKKIKNISICIWGDILQSRCAHSVLISFALSGANIILMPKPKSDVPISLVEKIKKISPSVNITIEHNPKNLSNQIDILYLTRLQKERRSEEVNYEPITNSEIEMLQPDGVFLHPLPRGNELSDEFLHHPKSFIRQHVKITYITRMWLIDQYLQEDKSQLFNFLHSPDNQLYNNP